MDNHERDWRDIVWRDIAPVDPDLADRLDALLRISTGLERRAVSRASLDRRLRRRIAPPADTP
jgi:hypothetical protein